jgi:hypothetical protein
MSTSGAPNAAPNGPLERPVSEALASFRRGEITLDDYLEAQVDTAVAHLHLRLPATSQKASFDFQIRN